MRYSNPRNRDIFRSILKMKMFNRVFLIIEGRYVKFLDNTWSKAKAMRFLYMYAHKQAKVLHARGYFHGNSTFTNNLNHTFNNANL